MPEVRFSNFSITTPDDAVSKWTLSTIILMGPTEENPVDPRMPTLQAPRRFQTNIIVTWERVDANETPESYVKRQHDELRQAGVSRREAAPPEKVKLSGDLEGFLTEQEITSPEGEQVRQLQLVTIKKGLAYTLITSQLVGAPFERMRDQFREILLSFK
jgi:hypothetical protein